jgi:hypothetical protein
MRLFIHISPWPSCFVFRAGAIDNKEDQQSRIASAALSCHNLQITGSIEGSGLLLTCRQNAKSEGAGGGTCDAALLIFFVVSAVSQSPRWNLLFANCDNSVMRLTAYFVEKCVFMQKARGRGAALAMRLC